MVILINGVRNKRGGTRRSLRLTTTFVIATVIVAFIATRTQGATGEFGAFWMADRLAAVLAEPAEMSATPGKMFSVETWSGDDNNDSNWTSGSNWAGVGGAGPDDDLVFPNVDAFHRRSSINDFPVNTNFNSLTFTGGESVVTGNQMFLANGMTVDTPSAVGDAPFIQTNIILGGSQTWSFASFTTSISGVVNLNNHTLTVDTVDAGGGVSLSGLINGTGTIDKTGPGTLFIGGDADTFGATIIDDGSVQVSGVLGNVTLSGGKLRGSGDVDAITGSGTIAPGNSATGSTAILTAHGNVTMSAGTTFAVDLNGTTPGTEYDRLTAPGGNISIGGATLTATLSPTVPTIGQQFIILQATGGHTLSGKFAQGNSVVIFGRLFSITYNSTNVALTAVRTIRTWDGDGGNFWNNANNWDGNFLPKVNLDDDLIFPAGASNTINHYDFANGSSFHNLSFTGNNYDIDGGTGITLTSGITENTPAGGTGAKIGFDITLGASQTFTSNGFGIVANPNGLQVTNQCTLNLNNFNLTFTGAGRQLYQGPITGTGNLIKNGTGVATFSGISTFTGGTQVNAGTLVVSGTLPGTVTLNGGTVGGSGTTGPITGSGGIAPGALPNSANFITAILNVNGNVTLSPGSAMSIQLGGASPGSEFDKVNVTGSIDLGAGTTSLDGELLNNFTPPQGQQFMIIQASGGVTGIFAQGNQVNFGGNLFTITYNANSVVLTAAGTTAAGVTISGRILTVDGRGVTNARVTMLDTRGGSRTVMTTRLGRFTFDEVETGQTFIMSVGSARYDFEPRLVQVFDTLSNVDFIGHPLH